MIVGSIKENITLEKRVSLTPDSARNIIGLGLKVCVEKGYALHLGINDIEYKDNELTIEGKKKEEEKSDYVHKGIANRGFKKVWHIEDHTEVIGAELKNGLLKVSLEKIVPEELKPKKIQINKKQERRSTKELLQEGAS